jgi:uncharacterized protein YbbC (DUF1343 family)
MKSIVFYPSTALFEGTVVTEGRGTDAPFLIFGHPDYHDQTFSFIPESKPGASSDPKFKGTKCYGMDMRAVSLKELRKSKQINLSFLLWFYNDLKLGEQFFIPYFDKLAGTAKLKQMIIEGKDEDQIRKSWQEGIEKYKKIRVKYLLYPDFN